MHANVMRQSSLIHAVNGFSFRDLNKNGKLNVYEDPRQPVDAGVEDLLVQITLEEKGGLFFINGAVVDEDGSTEDKDIAGFTAAAMTQMRGQQMDHFNLWQIPGAQIVASGMTNFSALPSKPGPASLL